MARQAAAGQTVVQDLEEQEALLPAETLRASNSCQLLLIGTLLVAAGLVSIFLVVFSAFVDTWLWPVLGLLLLMGHGLLLKATADKEGPSRVSSVAFACETLAYLALVATYFFRSFMVPRWWWVANAFLLCLPAGALAALACLYLCGSSSKAEKASTPGYFLLALADLLVALLLILAGSAAVQEWIRSLILPVLQGMIAQLATSTRSFDGPYPSFPTCDLTTSSCSLGDFEQNQWTVVRAGGSTSCLVGEFRFLVYRGDPGKVLLHLHGGGACWNWVTFVVEACTRDWTSTMEYDGIFDPSNRLNPFYGYTMINVPYCSGDIFGGAKENFWILANQTGSAWKKQSGYANLDAVMTWTEAQFQNDGLHQLKSFVLSGESAGSLGLQVWGSTILNRLKGRYDSKDTYLILDSFVGAMVDNRDLLQRQVMDFWNFCDSGVVPANLQSKCHPDTLFLRDFVNDTLSAFPDVRYLPVDSKFDEVQIAFADMLMALDSLWILVTQGLDNVPLFNDTAFYNEITEMLTRFVSFPQFAVYLVNSSQHTYTGYPLRDILRVTPAGAQNDCSDPDVGERLLPWLAPSPERPPFQCYDLSRDSTMWTGTYCSYSLPWVVGKCGKLSADMAETSEKVGKSEEVDKLEKVDKPEEVDKAENMDKSKEDKAEK